MTLFKKIRWWLFVVYLSCRWIGKLNIGSTVIYCGRRYTLIQGAAAPIWELLNADGERIELHEREFTRVHGVAEYLHDFQSGYHFYMAYWFRQWVHGGIKPWMRGCNIWKVKR